MAIRTATAPNIAPKIDPISAPIPKPSTPFDAEVGDELVLAAIDDEVPSIREGADALSVPRRSAELVPVSDEMEGPICVGTSLDGAL